MAAPYGIVNADAEQQEVPGTPKKTISSKQEELKCPGAPGPKETVSRVFPNSDFPHIDIQGIPAGFNPFNAGDIPDIELPEALEALLNGV